MIVLQELVIILITHKVISFAGNVTQKQVMNMLSQKVKRLLTREEDIEVEFKEVISKEITDTMVAMANAIGGFILIGVRDSEDEKGRQIGEVVGITISDDNKLKIIQKAQSVIDKLFPKIWNETDDAGRSIYVVQILEGPRKPYCTQGGRYLMRADGNNTAITPSMLEDLIIERLGSYVHESKKDVEEPLETLQEEFTQFVGRLRDEWNAESDSDRPSTNEGKTILKNAFHEVLNFKSKLVRTEGTKLPEILAQTLKGIKSLLKQNVMDGLSLSGRFWLQGDMIIELLETALEEFKRLSKSLDSEKA